ncbi:MAG: sugar phosphate isomerase/epimerase [Clostridia bacterium]|nr:sugar phosphate isomerase/epimerase [Clostridia bacterium]
MKIGAQLYTLRDFCKNLDDFSETLKKVADIGYTTVQVSGTCAYEAEWLRDELKKNGLTCGITHFSYDRILNDTEAVIREHKTFGCSYIGIGGMPGGPSKYAEFIAEPKLRPAMDKIAAAGCLFMYHNHSGEYEIVLDDGRPVMFHLSDEFTPAQMGFTLDTYWVKYGGYDVIPEIERLAGRLPVVHFKDMFLTEDGERRMSWVGGGNVLDFEKIVPAFEKAGTKYAYIEQDNCNGEDPFDCLKKSYDYLRSLGLD